MIVRRLVLVALLSLSACAPRVVPAIGVPMAMPPDDHSSPRAAFWARAHAFQAVQRQYCTSRQQLADVIDRIDAIEHGDCGSVGEAACFEALRLEKLRGASIDDDLQDSVGETREAFKGCYACVGPADACAAEEDACNQLVVHGNDCEPGYDSYVMH